jgi:NADPH:quinone reductase-like Zn-dependent oxidoreductase
MRAISQQRFGGPEVLKIVEVDRPRPIPTEVLVRVRAIGINPVEAKIRSGARPLLGDPPFVLGWDISGVVEEVLFGVTRFRRGDEVYGMPSFPRAANAYAEFVAAPSRQLASKPTTLAHAHAAALPLAGLTAWQGLVDAAHVDADQTVLIHGAGGGVGHLAVQIAKLRGAHVTATASAAKRDFIERLGADVVLDYDRVDFVEALGGLDVVFNLVDGDYGERSLRVLRRGGLLVTTVDRTNAELAGKAEAAGIHLVGVTVEPDYVGLETLTALVENQQLSVHVDRTFPLEEAPDAHRLIESGHVTGKVVLTP